MKIILDLCAGSGAWSRPYQDNSNYKVVLIDPIIDGSDVRLFKKNYKEVYGILCAPPCTVFANSGARWPRTQEQILEALSIVDACLRQILIYKPVFWALENPVGKLKAYLGEPKIRFHPYYYGDPYTKLTCLWGNFNVPIRNEVIPTEGSKLHRLSPGPNRQRLRSITPSGFAKAFFEANQ